MTTHTTPTVPAEASVPLPGPIETDPTGELASIADRHGEADRINPAGQVARAMLDQALSGITLGAYDRRVVAWLARRDQPTIATVASLLHRSRAVGATDGREEADTQLRASLVDRDADPGETARELAATEGERYYLAWHMSYVKDELQGAAFQARDNTDSRSAQEQIERLLDTIQEVVAQIGVVLAGSGTDADNDGEQAIPDGGGAP
jgi:hypothetical protein